jgi:hypothetical protein
MMRATVNRTKMSHVKHFGTFGPPNRTNPRVENALKSVLRT